MSRSIEDHELNIYQDNPDLQEQIKIAARNRGISVKAYWLRAIRQQLAEDGVLEQTSLQKVSPEESAAALDKLRKRIGPIGSSVTDLVAEGRRR